MFADVKSSKVGILREIFKIDGAKEEGLFSDVFFFHIWSTDTYDV